MKLLEEGQIAQKRSKFKEIMEKGEEDRISALTDCLLLDILSRLPSTRDAIRTGLLSKRWENLWTSSSSLSFTYFDGHHNPDFALAVDKTLAQCCQLKLKKFKLEMIYDNRFESLYNKWIRYAISCTVEDLNLMFRYIRGEDYFQLEQSFFINSGFTDLTLAGCIMNPAGSISWTNLRSLCLAGMYLNEDLIVNIVSGSPLLDTLVFQRCYPDDDDEPDTIEVNAPKTSKLTQCPQLKLKKFKLITDGYTIPFGSQLYDWISYVVRCNVEELHLMFWNIDLGSAFMLDQIVFTSSCFTHLSLAGCIMNPTGSISWTNLRSLCLTEMKLNEDLIVNIVSGSPLLDTLVFDCCYPGDDDDEPDTIEVNAPKTSKLTNCPQVNLKKFEVSTCSDKIPFESQLSEWIRYAVRCKVEELGLVFWSKDFGSDFMLDQIVFTSSCFTHLSLGCIINPIGAIGWKNLKSLCIAGYRSLNEDLIENILSGSPVLETLVLRYCYGYRRLEITSKSVKNLVLSGYKGRGDESEADVIKINAPYILSLKIRDDILLRKPLLLNVSSLVKVKLDYTSWELMHPDTTPNEEAQEMFKGFIQNLCHVKEVGIGYYCSKVFSCLEAKGFIFTSNVKLLE